MGRSSAPSEAPAHLFDCAPNFFDSALVYRGDEATADPPPPPPPPPAAAVDLSALSVQERDEEPETADDGDAGTAGGARWTCVSCRAVFSSSDEQRSHFKLDYHRLNVKRRVVGKDPVSEEEFEALAEGHSAGVNDDLSSISGSDDESEDPDQSFSQPRRQFRSNRIYFILPEVKQVFSIWRSTLLAEREHCQTEKESSSDLGNGQLFVNDDGLLLRLKSLMRPNSGTDGKSSSQPQTWIVLLAAGGHFAGIVVKVGTGEVLDHHTFHRYVVRAKAGGRQSTQDKSGRAPKSAGSSLRRYNEAALQKEIRNLLSSWGGFLQSSSHIFVHAPSANGQALFGGENAPLSHNDLRIRRIPFTTRRPTFKEAKRVYHILAAISYGEETNIPHEGGIIDGRKEGAKRGIKVGDGQQGKGKEVVNKKNHGHVKGAAEGAKSGLAGVATVSTPSGLEQDEVDLQRSNTQLHEAARAGNSELVLRLLEDGLDPCSKDEGGYTPYARAGDKETRNVFRRFMAKHPDLWDWQAASVPSALTEEMEAAQAAKQAEKDTKRKEREKERKKLKREQERAKEAEKKAAELAAAALATVRGTALPKKTAKSASTSAHSAAYQEALLKAQADEREKRAAAAEIRMRSMMASREKQPTPPITEVGSSDPPSICSCCGDSLAGKTPFHRFSYQYCSTTCVQVHKKYLDSQ